MKIFKNIKWLLLVAMAPIFASCSWEDLPAYEDANITGATFYYRYNSPTDKDPITGEPMVRNTQLDTSNRGSVSINQEAGTVSVVIYANPGSFPESVYSGISLNNLVGTVQLSTAARISPQDNHKALGLPDDWTSPHTFTVMAANGTKKTWTVTVTALNKD